MAPRTTHAAKPHLLEIDRRERFSRLNVLIADHDHRTASLVQRILFSFGFRNLDVTTNGESALALLRTRPYDIIITEWNMQPVDGLSLVLAIRNAREDKRIRRDIPIIMLTARSDINSVQTARDAGITEFLAKPFSAKTISNRIIQIIDNPRVFVESPRYVGPDRRRRGEPPPGMAERRVGNHNATLHPANAQLQQQIGKPAADILDEMAVTEAQAELAKAESEFIHWAHDDILRLERAFAALSANTHDRKAHVDLLDAAYAIKSQAGIFGYPLGTEVAALMVDYLNARKRFTRNDMIVLGKHIDAVGVIFKQQIKDHGLGTAIDMIHSLKKLIQKLG